MLSLKSFLVILTLFHFSSSTPIALRADRQAKLDLLRHQFKGIYWDTTAEECTDEQFDIIAEAVQVAFNDVLPLGHDHFRRFGSPAFNRFFIRPLENGIQNSWANNEQFTHVYWRIMDAMDSVAKFAKIGKPERDGTFARRRQIKYKCKPFPNIPCQGTQSAKTSVPDVDPDNGWSTVFCPTFFREFKYIKELGNGPIRPPSQLPLLHAFEHVIIHEWMHSDLATGLPGAHHITDLETELPGHRGKVLINGATLSHQLAWKNAINVPSTSVNVDTSINADNYAWYYTNEWFSKRWGWKDDGRTMVLDEGLDEGLDRISFDDPGNPEGLGSVDLNAGPPPNCHATSDQDLHINFYCSYNTAESSDQWAEEVTQPFWSEGGCQLSAACHMPFGNTTAIDPACTCNCEGLLTNLSDDRCNGYEGVSLSDSEINEPSEPSTVI